MSERVTWEACPCCGACAAVGWTEVRLDGAPPREVPVEFDCPGGCRPSPGELSRLHDRLLGDWRWWTSR